MTQFERTYTVDTRFVDSAGEDRVWFEGTVTVDGADYHLSDEDGPSCIVHDLIWATLPDSDKTPPDLESDLAEAIDAIDGCQGTVTVRCSADDVWTVSSAVIDTVEERLYKLAVQLRTGEIGLEVYSAAVKAELAKAGW